MNGNADVCQPILNSSLDFLRPKICLMSLIDLVFRLPSSSRTNIPFPLIASETKLPTEEVEYLLMKALSLDLVKGSIDQVNQEARIVWVQPRVLAREQIAELRDRFDGWSSKVRGLGESTVVGAGELMAQ